MTDYYNSCYPHYEIPLDGNYYVDQPFASNLNQNYYANSYYYNKPNNFSNTRLKQPFTHTSSQDTCDSKTAAPSKLVGFARPKKKSVNKNLPTVIRKGGGKYWSDSTLLDWPERDFRLFVGNLGNEIDDRLLKDAFKKYKSFHKCRVIRDSLGISRGYGFVSLLDPHDGVLALKEMNGKYIGQRPCIIKKSKMEERTVRVKK